MGLIIDFVDNGPGIPKEEYENAIGTARELGFESLYLQFMESTVHNLPDFDDAETQVLLDKMFVEVTIFHPIQKTELYCSGKINDYELK